MGLFSSEIQYYAHAGSSVMLPEEERRDTVKSLIIQSTMDTARSPYDAIIVGLNTNMYARVRSMIRYANKPGGYVRGLPETSQFSIAVDDADVIAAIEADVGEPIVAHTIRYGNFNEGFFIARALHDSYLNPTYFPWPSGDPADDTYRLDAAAAIPVVNPDTTTYYMAESYPDFIRVGTSYNYQVTFRYTNNLSVASTWNVAATYDLAAYVEPTWIMVEYFLASDLEDLRYWIYEVGSGDDPDLEAAISSESVNLLYLPVAILMTDKVWFDEEADPEIARTTKRLLKDLTLDPYDMKEQYLEQKAEDDASGDANRSNAETWDFFVHFGVPIHSHIRGSREYIWRFLRFLEANGQWTTFDQYQAFLSGGGTQPASWLHVQEGGDTGYHALYGWSYIYSVTYPGFYTPEGFAEPLRPRRMYSQVYDFGSAGYDIGIIEVHGAATPIATSESDTAFHDYAVFTRQNEDETYTQTLIMAPTHFYVVNTSVSGDLRLRYVDVELFPEDPEELSEFRFPVHIGTLRETATMHREEMLQDALTATVYLVEKIKVKWYQKTFFKWLIIIIAIIVVVLAQQYHLLYNIALLATAAVGIAAVGLWLLFFVVSFAIGFLISFAGSLIGGTWGKIFVLVASIYLAGGTQAFTNPMNAWSSAANSFTTAPGWGTAFSFIQTVTPYLKIGVEYYNSREMAKMEADMRDWDKTTKEKYEELRDAWDQLGTHPPWLDPMEIVRMHSENFYVETPEDFFSRTLNANPGLLGYDLVNNFADIALRLPDKGEDNILEKMFEDLARQRGEI